MKQVSLLLCCIAFFHVSRCQTITTIGGTGSGGFSGDGGPATLASIAGAWGVCLDETGLLYVVDGNNYRIRTINSSGIINTFAGSYDTTYSGDGGPATAAGIKPRDVASDGNGNTYLACQNHNRVRMVNSAGIITTLAGNGGAGYSGDGWPATAAQVGGASRVATDKRGNIYIAHASVLRRVDAAGIITTVAGSSASGFGGDGGPATAALFNSITGIALDDTGNIYVMDGANYRIRKIDLDGIVTTIAGTGSASYSGDGGPASVAGVPGGGHLAIDALNNIYLSDVSTHRVRKISTGGIISTIAGTGVAGFSGDGGPAILAQLWNPYGIAVDSTGNVYLGVASNLRVRMIDYNNNMPAFSGGHSQALAVCENSGATSLAALLTVTDADAGQPLTWVLSTAPANGTAVVSFAATSTGGAVIPSGVSYTPAAGFWGNDTFTVRIDDGITAYKSTIYVMVAPFHAGPLSGPDSVCTGGVVTIAGSATGGVWSSSNPSVASVSTGGVVTATGTGTAIISYTVTNACGTITATHPFKVFYTPECPTAVNECTLSDVANVFPNPCSSELHVAVRQKAYVKLVDVTGREVARAVVDENHSTISLAGVPPGMLFVIVTGAGGRILYRVIKL